MQFPSREGGHPKCMSRLRGRFKRGYENSCGIFISFSDLTFESEAFEGAGNLDAGVFGNPSLFQKAV